MQIDPIARTNHFTALLDFEDDRLRVEVRERAGLFGAMPLTGCWRP